MESYYSSDEEIAWGPITIREIEGDFKRAAKYRKPNKRHTVIGDFKNCKMDTETLSEGVNKLNISSTSSTAYFTPNESLKTNSNSDFLEKLSSVINTSNSDLSKYASVNEDSANSINKSEEHSAIKSQKVPFIPLTDSSLKDNINMSNSYLSIYASVKEDSANSTKKSEEYTPKDSQTIPFINLTESSPEDDINMSNSDLSKYASVIEDSPNSVNKSEEHRPKESPNIPFIHITEATLEDNSCQNFIDAFENRNSYYDIEKFQQTLVENTCILSENSITEEEIIVISDESNTSINSSNSSEDLNTYKNNFDMKEEAESVENSFCNNIQEEKPTDHFMSDTFVKYDCSGNDMDEYVEKKIDRDHRYQKPADHFITDEFVEYKCTEKDEGEYIENKFKNVMENKKLTDHFYTGNDDSDIDEENNEISFFNTPNRQLSTIKETLSTSPVVVPDIDLKQFDDSSSKDDSLQLNDTLEEMNRFLCQGLNYSMPDDEIIDNTPAKGATACQEIITPVNQAVPVNKQLFCHKKEKPSHIPKGKFTFSEKKTTNKATVSHVTPKSDFKVPGTLFRTKPAPPTTPKHNSNLKNIVSPVALYIKNSPRVPLVKHVHPREHPINMPIVTSTSKNVQSNKENFPDFCEVVYKPSKKQIASTEKHIVIPRYMRNLKIKESEITKHEGRINRKPDDGEKVSERLLQSDITNTTVDQSLLDSTGNVSVLTSKQAFIK